MEQGLKDRPVRDWRIQASRAARVVALAVLTALAGCGGGDDGAPPSNTPSGTATLDAAGGKVVAEGAEVSVPAGALAEPVTMRIASNSRNAPPRPSWFRAAGDILELTPHGGAFAQPVTVRLKAPAVTLADDERILIAKAPPGGTWTLLSDTQLRDGMLEVRVSSFSFFMPIVVKFPKLRPQDIPFGLGPLSLECDGASCTSISALSLSPITVSAQGNGGVFPAGCASPEIDMGLGAYDQAAVNPLWPIAPRVVATRSITLRSSFPVPATTGRSPVANPPVGDDLPVWASLVCADPQTGLQSSMLLAATSTRVLLPATGLRAPVVRRFPAALTVAAGEATRIVAVMSGGSVALWGSDGSPSLGWVLRFTFLKPETDTRVTLQRLPANATSWVDVQTQTQGQANARPLGGNTPVWMFWSLDWDIPAVTAADNGTRYRVRSCSVVDDSGRTECAVGPAATLTVVTAPQAPSFSAQPGAVMVVPGQTASLSVSVGGVPAPAIQWQSRPPGSSGAWSDVAGATSASFTTPALQAADNGIQFRAVASNSAGSVPSDGVAVGVSAVAVAPTINAQPQPLTVIAGSQALFAVGASGTAALSYQWSKNGTPITGANGPQLLIAGAQAADAGSYRVVVSNTAGSATSNAVTLAVNPSGIVPDTAPGIVTQPAPVNATAGNTATFAVSATGTAPLAFQWRRNGVAIAGATAAAMTIPVVLATDAGDYSVVVTNAAGSATSQAASLAVSPAAPAPTAPTIVQQPGSVVAVPGFGAAIGVTASGSGPLGYRWFRNGVELPSQSSAVLTIANAGAGDDGSYRVEVSNAVGTAVSSTVQLTLLGAPAITQQPAASTAASGTTATFSVVATGDALRYQWLRNGAVVPGATGASHTTASLLQADSGAVYSVVVFNGAGAQVSAPALLTVTPPAATGVLLAHEGFAYTLGDNLAGKSGGSGWSGAWTATDGYLSPLAASASGTIVAGLGYIDSGGRRLLASGGAWSSSAGVFFGQIQRASVDKPGAAGSTRWLSMIVRQDAPPTGINYVMAAPGRGWSFGSSATAMAAGIGGTGVFVNCWYCSGTPATAPIAGWAQGSTALLLVRVDFAVSGNDTVSLWINPTLDPAVDIGAPTATASLSNFAEMLDGVTVGWGDFRSFTVDELRIGTGRTAVLPIATP
jgi:hypothetical protein